MTTRLSTSSLAGTARTLVAVGMASEASMFCTSLAATPEALLDCVNNVFMRGKMPGAVRTQILSAVNAITGTSTAVYKARAQAAVYLTVSSAYYNVEH